MSTRTSEIPVGQLPRPVANEQFKRRSRTVFRVALAGAALIHLLVFAFGPTVAPPIEEATGIPAAAMRMVTLPDGIEILAPPSPIEAPAPPVVAPAPPIVTPVALPHIAIPQPLADSRSPAEGRPLAFEIPPPPAPAEEDGAGEFARYRHVTPYMMAPELVNRAEVQRELQRRYPRTLQRAGVEGELLVWFWIDETGAIRKYEIRKSSGRPALDEVAAGVIDIMEFRPAVNAGRPVKVIVMLPIRFRLE